MLADELGYDSLWVYDHFHNVPVPAHETMFECWTTLAAISQRTTPHPPRPDGRLRAVPQPRAAGQDHVEHRRHVAAGGSTGASVPAGTTHEFKAYGYDFPSNADRIRMLRETVEIVKLDVDRARRDLRGPHFSVDGRAVRPQAGAVSRTRRSGSVAAASS